MNLFEIESEIIALESEIVDPETGEINEEAYARLEKLELEDDRKTENIACWIRNLDSDVEALEKQKQIFADRKKRAENKRDALKRYLAAHLHGEKRTYDRVAISFRKSSSVVIDDEEGFLAYAQNGHDEWLKYGAPEINKTAIKDAIKSGKDVRFARIEEKQNIIVK